MAKKSIFSFGFWFGGIWLFAGLPFLIIGIYIGVQTWQQQAQLKQVGQVTTGMVLTKSRTTKSSKSSGTGTRSTSTSYEVGYRFQAPDGKVVKGEQEISSRLWDRLEERGPIQVTFVPSRPDIHRIEGQGAGWMLPIIFTFLGLVFVPIGGFIFFKALAGPSRQRRLRERGMTVEGIVLEVAQTKLTINDVPQWSIQYSYRDHKGKEHKAKSPHMSPEEAEAWKVGDTGSVRYDFRSPRKSVWLGETTVIRITFGFRHLHLWVGAMFLLVGPIGLQMGIQQAGEESRYRKQGNSAEAIVLDKWIKKAKGDEDSRTRYEISYRFTDAQGRPREGTGEIEVEQWENLQKGNKIKVTYLPDSPNTSRTEGSGDRASPIIAMALGGLLTVVGGVILIPGFARLLGERRLRRSGTATEGEVIKVEPTKVSVNRVRQWVIRYRYKDHMGQVREGKTGMLPPNEAQAWNKGDKGEVRFNQQRPEKSMWIGKG